MSGLIRNLGLLARQVKHKISTSYLAREMPTTQHINPRVVASYCANKTYFSTINRTSTCDSGLKILQKGNLDNHLINISQVRFKKKRGREAKEEDEADDDDDDLANENPLLVDDLFGNADEGCQNLTIDVNSLRLDSVCKTGFAITRAKVEEHFYKGDIYVNSELATKKSQELSLNDEIDLIKGNSEDDPNMVCVKRLIIHDLPDKSTEHGRLKIKIQRWSDLVVEHPAKRGGSD